MKNLKSEIKIDSTQLQALYSRNDLISFGLLVFLFGSLIFLFALCAAADNYWVYGIAFILISAIQHWILIVQHEALHYLLFKNRAWNEWTGYMCSYLVGFTMRYRDIHLKHHDVLGSHEDPDGHNYRDYPKSRQDFIWDIIVNFTGLSALIQFTRQSFIAKKEGGQKKMKFDAGVFGVLITHATLFIAFYAWGYPAFYFFLWLLPLVTLTKGLAHFRNVVEHSMVVDVGDPEISRYRTIYPTLIEAFFLAPMNFNYHAEHHLYPGICFYNLPQAHKLLLQNPSYQKYVEIAPKGYLAYLLKNLVKDA